MGALVREASGPFVLSEARMIEEIAGDPSGALIPPEHIIPFPTIVLDLRGSSDFRAGRDRAVAGGSAREARLRARRDANARRRRRDARSVAGAAKGLHVKIRHDLMREIDRPLVLAIGFFDGLHLGHREIVRATLRMRKPGRRAGVLTFANHPASYLRPGTEPPLLATPQERLDRLAEAGFEECFFVPFDEQMASMGPQEFLDMLVARIGVCGIAVGETFRFGHKRTGDVDLMRSFLASRNVEIVAVPSVSFDGDRVSSTRIRALVAAGDIERADALLGCAYELRGIVEIGAGRGHGLGFPTANIRPPEKLLPKDGVYAAVARYDGRDCAALLSVGTNPQFGDDGERTVEVWLRDFRGTIYGRELSVRDLRFVRAQHAFASIDDLVAQMRRDLEAVAYPSFA